ncbi:MAG: hypothetical protein JWQ47_1972 [Glaciihabitans sp.]|nr:hypothetical protein [Glaciihabitans sp.]
MPGIGQVDTVDWFGNFSRSGGRGTAHCGPDGVCPNEKERCWPASIRAHEECKPGCRDCSDCSACCCADETATLCGFD